MSHILIFFQILKKICEHEFALSYTDHIPFFSSGLEHRLWNRGIKRRRFFWSQLSILFVRVISWSSFCIFNRVSFQDKNSRAGLKQKFFMGTPCTNLGQVPPEGNGSASFLAEISLGHDVYCSHVVLLYYLLY